MQMIVFSNDGFKEQKGKITMTQMVDKVLVVK